MKSRLPYGSWPSPISAAMVAHALRGTLWQVRRSGDEIYWLEVLPHEGGRTVIRRRRPSGTIDTVTPQGFDVRTRVHEYGGGDYLVVGERIVFARKEDQRLYVQSPGRPPEPVTPPSTPPGSVRFADGDAFPHRDWMAWVREIHHDDGTTDNDLVRITLESPSRIEPLARGHDFYAAPRVSPDGRRLAFLTWDHPQMPWDGTELWLASVGEDGSLHDLRRIAGGPDESVVDPRWSPQGRLHFLSDRSGWWNLYEWTESGPRALTSVQAELGAPAWTLGLSRYAFLDDGSIVFIVSESGMDHLACLEPGSAALRTIEGPWTSFYPSSIVSHGVDVWTIAGAPGLPQSIVRTNVPHAAHEIVHASFEPDLDAGIISHPSPIRVPVGRGEVAHALAYAPTHPAVQGLPGARPPLIVMSHGGPTSFALTFLLLHIQFWTSRGIAVVDVNYRGSAGYGRSYRRALNGRWGLADVEDCVAAARSLAAHGQADPARLVIRGGSAGGFTTLCALAFHQLFAAGVSYYGVGDLESLARDTHKFEAHYLDSLVGPYPDAREVYRQRSPIHFVDQITCPVILFQGLDDRVVPPAQSEAIACALDSRRLPHAHLTFPGEGHGFRSAATVERCQQAELSFLGRVLQFPTEPLVPPLEIRHLPDRPRRSRET